MKDEHRIYKAPLEMSENNKWLTVLPTKVDGDVNGSGDYDNDEDWWLSINDW